MPRGAIYVLVGLFALLTPAAIAVLILPTPSSDTRELFAWGHFFTLSTIKHPPMMQWIGGLTERVFAPTEFWAVIVTQLLNAAGLAYLYAILRVTAERGRAAIFTLLFAASSSIFAAPLPFALNADILLFPSWAAVIFHTLGAQRGTNPLHWVCLALASAIAAYTKYTSFILLLSLVLASLLVGDYRGLWRRWPLWLAALAGAVLFVPHVWSVAHSGAVGHAIGLLNPASGFWLRADSLRQIAMGILIWLAPAWIVVGVGLLNGDCVFRREMTPEARLLRMTTLVAFMLLIVLTAGFGLIFESRYDLPFLSLLIVSVASLVGFEESRWLAIEARVLSISFAVPAVALVVISVVYGLFASHADLQEPTGQAAAAIEKDWSGQYSCGPAYILGDVWSAYGIAIASTPPAIGVPVAVKNQLSWFDPRELKRLGGIVVYRDAVDAPEVERAFPGMVRPAIRTISLPFLRSWAGQQRTYAYFFLAPEDCPAGQVLPTDGAKG